jgi:hypothetical protein
VSPPSFGRALSLGVRAGTARAGAPLLVGLAAAGGATAAQLLWVASAAALLGARPGVLAPGLLVCLVLAWMLEAAMLGGAVQQQAAALRQRAIPSLAEAVVQAAPRSLPWGALAALALLAWTSWQLGVGLSGTLLYLRGLFAGAGGLAGALALALVATLGPLGAILIELLLEMALVRSVCRDEPLAVAGSGAASALLARPGLPLGLWALTAVLAAAVSGTAAVLAGLAAPVEGRYEIPIALVQAAIGALAGALAVLVRLGAFTALELDRSGELPAPPPPPRPPPVPRAELIPSGEPILEARAVGPPPGTPG